MLWVLQEEYSLLLEKVPFQKGFCTKGSKQEIKNVVCFVKDCGDSTVRVFLSSFLKDTEYLTGMGGEYCVRKLKSVTVK